MLNDAKLVKGDLNLLQELLDDSWISGIYIAGHGNDPEAPPPEFTLEAANGLTNEVVFRGDAHH